MARATSTRASTKPAISRCSSTRLSLRLCVGAPSFSVIANASAYARCEFARLPPIMTINAAGKRREEMVVIGRCH